LKGICPAGPPSLAPEPQARYKGPIPFDILATEIVEQPAPAAHHQKKPPPRMVVLSMGFEVLRQFVDAPAEDGDLNLGRACIGLPAAVVADQRRLLVFEQCHWFAKKVTTDLLATRRG